MNWFEQRIRRYEHRRWTTDDNRRTKPFFWGAEHVGGRAEESDPHGFFKDYTARVLANSHEWYEAAPAEDYQLDKENVLTFSSSIESPWKENNTVHAHISPQSARKARCWCCQTGMRNGTGSAVSANGSNGSGITAMKMSLPYHDRRMANGHERADQLVGSNIGLTLQANRQAVQDAKRCLRWLEQEGYSRVGILGDQYRLVGGLHHDDARPRRACGRVFPRFDILRRCGEPGHDHEPCLGRAARTRQC